MSNIIKTCFGEEEALDNRLVGSPEKKKDAVDGFIYVFTKNLFTSGNNIDFLFDASEKELTQLFENSYKEFFNVMMSEVAKIKKEYDVKTVKDLEEILDYKAPRLRDNWNIASQKTALYQEVIDFLKRNGLNTSLEIDDATLTEIITKSETDEPTQSGLVIDPFDTDPTKVITNNIKLLCATLPQVEVKNGMKEFSLNSFGFPKLVDSDFVKRTILNTVVGSRDMDDMFKKLDARFYNRDLHQYNKGYTWIDNLKQKLNVNVDPTTTLSNADLKLIVGFEVSFSKMLPELYKLVLSKDKPNYSYNSLERDNNVDVTTYWNNNVIAKINDAELFGTAKDSFFKHLHGQPNILTIDRDSKEYKDFTNASDISSKVTRDNLEKVLDKLSLLGIDFKRPLDEIYNNTSNVRTILNSYGWLVDALNKRNLTDSFKITTFDGLFGDISTGDIAKLTRVFNDINPSDKNFSTRNAEGDSKYVLNDFSTAGLDCVTINNAQSIQDLFDTRKDLTQQRYFNPERNLTVKILFNEKGERYPSSFYKLVVVDGIGIEEVNEGKNTRNLSLNDSILQKFTNSLQGVYTLGINADKNTEWAIQLSSAYMPIVDTKSPKEITKVFTDMLMDEMDAAMQDILIPSYIDPYQGNVWKLGYFREIVGIKNVRSFIKEVLDVPLKNEDQDYNKWSIDRSKFDNTDDINGAWDNYKARRDKWIERHYMSLSSVFNNYIDNVVSESYPVIVKALNLVKTDKGFTTKSIDTRLIKSLLGSEVEPDALTESQIKDLIRFANINFEIARNEQNKLHFGHPCYYKDPVKRYSMFMGVKRLLSKNTDVLQQMYRDLPRTDLRADTISDSDKRQYIRKVTYAEPVYMQEGHEQLAEEFYKGLKETYKDTLDTQTLKEIEVKIGAEFNDDGSFKNLILNKKGSPTGYLVKYLGVNGADSQEYFNYDFYWQYRQLLGDMSPDDWKLKEYDWAYDVYELGTADPKSGYYYNYPKDLIEKAKNILDKYNHIAPLAPQGNFKPQYAGRSDKGNPVGVKLSGQYECWRTIKGTGRAKAYIEHKKQGIDMYGWESAEKFGVLTNKDGSLNNFYDLQGKYSDLVPPIQFLDPSGMGKQAEMPPHEDVKGTQKEKQTQADVHPDLIPVRNELNETKNKYVLKAKDKLLEASGLTPIEGGYKATNPSGLVDRLKRNLRSANVSDDQINALKVIKGENGLFYINGVSFDAHPSKDAIERMLWSSINKEVVSPRQFGIPALITPELGTESDTTPIKYAYLDKETKKYVYVDNAEDVAPELRDSLQIVSKRNTMQRIEDDRVMPTEYTLPWPYSKFKIEGRPLHPKDLGLVQGNDGVWRDEKGIQNPKIFTGIGWRIPTPGKNSISHIKASGIYGPERGQIATVPSSEVGRTDQDFDGDKYYTAYPNVRIVRNDFGSDKFKDFFIDYLKKEFGYQEPEEEFKKWDEKSLKRLNHAAWTVKGAEIQENEAGSIEQFAKGDREAKEYLSEIKKTLQAYNLKYKDNIVLEPIDPEEDSLDGLSNKIFDLQWKLLEAKEGYAAMMSPITLGDIPSFAQELKNLLHLQQDERNYTSIHQMIPSEVMRQSYIKFKDTIGVLARASTFHVLANISPIELTGSFNGRNLYFLYYPNRASADFSTLRDLPIKNIFETNKNSEGKDYLGGETDIEGNNTGQKITSALQAALEVVKNNDIKDSGINKHTAGQAMYHMEKGTLNQAMFRFLNLPIVKDYLQMWEDDNSMQTKLSGVQKYRSGIAFELLSKWYNGGKTTNAYKKAVSFFPQEALDNFKKFGKSVPPTKSQIKQRFYSEIMSRFDKSGIMSIEELTKHVQATVDSGEELKKEQAILLVHYLMYEQQARQLFSLNRNINRDTANIGTFGQYALLNRLEQKIEDSGMFTDPNAIFKNTFVGGIKDSVTQLSKELSTKYFISMDQRLQPVMEKMLNYIDNDDKFLKEDDKVKTINRFQNFILNYLLQTIPDNDGMSHYAKAQKLMFGNSIPLKLSNLRKKYPDNIFLKNIQPLIDQNINSAGTMRLFKMNNTLHDINLITDSAITAYKSTDFEKQDLRDFFNDLAVYSMLQTGGQGNRNSIQKIVPYELWIKEVGHLLEKVKNNPEVSLEEIGITDENLFRQFIQNNTNNIDLVPIVNQDRFTSEINFDLISISAYDPITSNDYIQARVPATLLYEKIPLVNDTRQVYYKRIPVLGIQGKHVEVYPNTRSNSLHKSNTPVITTDVQIQNYLRDKLGDVTIDTSLDKENNVSLSTDPYENLSKEELKYLEEKNSWTEEKMQAVSEAYEKGEFGITPEIIEKVYNEKYGKSIDFQEEPTIGYRDRTIKNASADATIAIAVDFNSAGERLTENTVYAQKKKYIPIDVSKGKLIVNPLIVQDIVEKLNSVNAKSLNIAGNGIYTMKGQYTQQQVDDYTYDLLNQVLNSPNLKHKIESGRSGGQTGFDEAGAKALRRLGVPTLVLAPKGFAHRTIEGKDIYHQEQFKARFGKSFEQFRQEARDLYKSMKEFGKSDKEILERIKCL